MLLDDVFRSLDSSTESIIAQRLLSPEGLIRRYGLTAVLTTHSGKYTQIYELPQLVSDMSHSPLPVQCQPNRCIERRPCNADWQLRTFEPRRRLCSKPDGSTAKHRNQDLYIARKRWEPRKDGECSGNKEFRKASKTCSRNSRQICLQVLS